MMAQRMKPSVMATEVVKEHLRRRGKMVETFLETCFLDGNIPERLREAMRYSLLAGGKRLRPVLCLSCAALCGGAQDAVLPFAASIEMIHTYSLIHDDLPAMDNDDLRRGKPSNHKAFDEATAILAGDALLTDAFTFMAGTALPPDQVLRAVATLAEAAGGAGMVGGQVLDMIHTGEGRISPDELRRMHAMKTGALIRASCVSGAQLAGADEARTAALSAYGTALGAAFQIADDILDVTADTATLGKPAGSDVEQGKMTYPALLGLEQSRRLAEERMAAAVGSLEGCSGPEAEFLRGLARYVVDRVA